jgi:hypothetical protein
MQPNNTTRFVAVDVPTALAARAEYKARTARLRAHLA